MPRSLRGCALTIGNFDGVHLGHQRIIRATRSRAEGQGAAAVAMTFEPPPELVLRPDSLPKRITPADQKVRILLDAGCDFVVVAKADLEFLAAGPADFIADVLVRRFAPSHVVEGADFLFGHKRAGNVDTLREAAPRAGFVMHVVEPVMIDLPAQDSAGPTAALPAGTSGRQRISSTLIRSLIEAGRVDQAAACIGREFALFGKVVSGTGRGGKLLGFPTINLQTAGQVIPADGVYAGLATVDGRRHAAAVSIGDNPTLGGTGRCVEAFLLDARGDFLGKEVSLAFRRLVGLQKKFDSPEALKRQIAEDVRHVRQIIENRS